MVKTDAALRPSVASTPRDQVIDAEIGRAKAWLSDERSLGTLLGEETLWREAYGAYDRAVGRGADDGRSSTWACVAAELVFETGKVPLNQRMAAREACDFLVANPGLGLLGQARRLRQIADEHNVDPGKVRALLRPGIGYPWVLPPSCWTEANVVDGLAAMLAPFEWTPGREPEPGWLAEHAGNRSAAGFVRELVAAAADGSDLHRILTAMASFLESLEREGKDVGAIEGQAFVTALGYHGLAGSESATCRTDLLALREAVLLLTSFHLYQRAEGLVLGAQRLADEDPNTALRMLGTAGNLYKRLGVAQMYPERVLERHQQVARMAEELRVDHGIGDDRAEQVLLVSTFQSPADLQRLIQSVAHELQGFAYGRPVHVVVSDASTAASRQCNEKIFEQATRAGMRIADWGSVRRDAFLDDLNDAVFPDGAFDVSNLAGMPKPGEKGIAYGRLRNFLRLAGLVELKENALERPVFTWLDQD
ncbi:MAG: hypothetical protein LC792_19670, partial [Actinobacteria bacterium]|nr:hypothetical protein [Actinomycetota bacterium]